MNLDFAQVITQVIAFIIVYWVVKKFGWAPLLKLMNERKQDIQSQFDSIEHKRMEVQKLKEKYHNKLAEVDSEKHHQIQEAITEGRLIAYEIQEESKKKAQEIIKSAHDEALRKVDEVENLLKNEMVKISFAAAKKILDAEIDEEKYKKNVADFVEHVELK